MVGKTVGKYRVLERIGRGGMGTVYKAVDETLDRLVAIKVLNSEFSDADVLKRFRAEAVTLARLNHPGIATIYELHRQEDELMMVMEFVRGETFHQLADRVGPLEPPQAANLCIQVLDALEHAHRAGVIHRDLKPANLMVTETGAVKVMDFGISRVLGSEHFTLGGLMMGTPAYMAPEQVMGQEIDARADLYAVGVVFYRLLSGRLPFQADTAIAMAQKQISDQPTPLAETRAGLPDWCTAIVDRALAKTASQRFQGAEDFRVALMSAVVPQSLGELPTLATPTGTLRSPAPVTRTAGTSLDSAAIALPLTPLPRERTATTVVLGRTHLVAIVALIVVLSAGVVVLALAAFGRAPTFVERAAASLPLPAAISPRPPAEPPDAPPPPRAGDAGGAGQVPTATAGSVPAPPRSTAASTPAPPGAAKPASAVAPTTAGAGTTTSGANTATPGAARSTPAATTPSATPSGTAPAATAARPGAATAPATAFGGVRALVTEGARSQERRGVLRIGNGEIALSNAASATVLTPIAGVRAIYYSRARQPRWLDDDGKPVASRVDLGKLGFLRGDRNWLTLITPAGPVILSVENPQLLPVSTALEAHTGMTIRRVQ